MEGAVRTGMKVPTGKWSDTRAMAWAASIYGIGFLEAIGEKAVSFGPNPEDMEIVWGAGWSKIEEGFWASNRHWEGRGVNTSFNHMRAMCKHQTCSAPKYASTDYCWSHQHVINEQQEIEGKKGKDEGSKGGTPPDLNFCPDTTGPGSNQQKDLSSAQTQVRQMAAGQEEEKVGEVTTLVKIPSQSDMSAIGWVRSLNPKRLRSSRGIVASQEDLERDKRLQNARSGITVLGPL